MNEPLSRTLEVLIACKKCGASVVNENKDEYLKGSALLQVQANVVTDGTGNYLQSRVSDWVNFCASCLPVVDDALQELGFLVLRRTRTPEAVDDVPGGRR